MTIELEKTSISLDIGCGEGSSIGAYDNRSHWVGVDSNIDKARVIALKYPKYNFVVADANNLPFRKEVFNHATMGHVLEHINNPNRALAEVSRVSRYGSTLEVATPGSQYEFIMQSIDGVNVDHRAIFNGKVVSLIKNNGYYIVNSEQRKWWAALTIIGRSKFFSQFPNHFRMDPDTGIWEPSQNSVARIGFRAVNRVVNLFEVIGKKLDKVEAVRNYLNDNIAFESYVSAWKT